MGGILTKEDGGVTLRLRIRPRLIERLFYLAIIVALAVFLILGTFCGDKCETSEETSETESTEAAAQELKEEEETETAAVEEEVVVEEEPEEEEEEVVVEEEPEVNETEEEPVTYSGKVDITINEVMTELKNEGAYGKVTGVGFTLKNEKEDFMPSVEIYTYEDGDTSSVFATKPREERIYSTLKFPNSNTYELSIASQQFVDLDEDVVCKVVIKDKATGEEIVTEIHKFKIT